MRVAAGCTIAVVIFMGTILNIHGSIEDTQRNFVLANFPYDRGLDNDLQLARILLVPQRMYHIKRNSELINSLLGLPTNMNNAGK
ncbi:pigment-dispersing hormone peptides [Cephus cinctus]|uniref:Pigment-dispersing hormone peptides n=1 Tax=Cephus cinctus TaxID=211228 RepID=A0AAJ7CCP0_CEPCN|nr:pigment-dispersing hormone peptides [Cephus cinctus]XP_024946341.1 pigment-dispersing hormone peptides [Cephus cinctus]